MNPTFSEQAEMLNALVEQKRRDRRARQEQINSANDNSGNAVRPGSPHPTNSNRTTVHAAIARRLIEIQREKMVQQHRLSAQHRIQIVLDRKGEEEAIYDWEGYLNSCAASFRHGQFFEWDGHRPRLYDTPGTPLPSSELFSELSSADSEASSEVARTIQSPGVLFSAMQRYKQLRASMTKSSPAAKKKDL